MFLRKVTQTNYGPVIDYLPGHTPDYILLVRIDETKISELEAILPKSYNHVLSVYNLGDRRGYSFRPILTSEQIKDITNKLVELGTQSFEFRDWKNKICPPTKEKVERTERSIFE